jgi:hypothetical protein
MKTPFIWGIGIGSFILAAVCLHHVTTAPIIEKEIPAIAIIHPPKIETPHETTPIPIETPKDPVLAPAKPLDPHAEKVIKKEIYKMEKKLSRMEKKKLERIKKLELYLSESNTKAKRYQEKIAILNKELTAEKGALEKELKEKRAKLGKKD